MNNGCPVCIGLGRLVALGGSMQPVSLPCPECAGMAITPASADDPPAADPSTEPSGVVEVVDQLP